MTKTILIGLLIPFIGTAAGAACVFILKKDLKISSPYNTYINTLRIAHFMRLYQTTIKTRQYVTAAELSYESGYKSYSTFSVAFKQINGQTVKSWMKQQE